MESYEAKRNRNPQLTEKQWLTSALLFIRKYLFGMYHDPILERWQCAEMERISGHISRILVADSIKEEMVNSFTICMCSNVLHRRLPRVGMLKS